MTCKNHHYTKQQMLGLINEAAKLNEKLNIPRLITISKVDFNRRVVEPSFEERT